MSMMRIDRAMSQAGKSTNSNALNTSTNSTSSLVSASSSPPKRTKSGSARASNFNSSSTSANGRRAVTASVKSSRDDSSSSGRVRVAARLRPRSAEEKIADADFPDCVELQPEFKRLRLRKNNWESETFQFDEVFTETASQKRVYEVVAKPVVESVLKGYNGTVMAYGQTGTGKTFTLGQLGEKDSAQRGIMIRALEDILADVNPEYDSVTVSYLQLYLESLQDLLAPEKDNIPIVEDPKSGDVSLPGATMVQVQDHKSFVQLLKTGEVNRYAANTKMNTESSRSHAILLVYVKRSVTEKKENENPAAVENGYSSQPSKAIRLPTVRNSKLLLVDLAGSERVNKAGSEGHTLEEAKAINLSLTALGKCINALAENSSHIPIRDSKLTRLLRDSFGGSARTSLVITIGPSPRHRGETASTIMFGQRAMKVENMVKLKEEFDYKSLCRKLENQLDMLTMENERQSKIANDTKQEMEKKLREVQLCQTEADKKLALGTEALMKEKSKMQEEIAELLKQLEQEHEHKARISKLNDDLKAISEEKEKELHAEYRRHQRELDSVSLSHQHEVDSLDRKLQAEYLKTESLSRELHLTKQELKIKNEKEMEAKTKKQEEQVVDLRQTYQKEVSEITQKLNMEYAQSQHVQEQMKLLEKKMNDHHRKNEAKDQYESLEIRKKLDDQAQYQKRLERELYELQVEKEETTQLKAKMQEELQNAKNKLQEEQRQRGLLEEEIRTLKQRVSQLSSENKKNLEKENSGKFSVGSECQTNLIRSSQMKDTINGQRATIAKLFEEVGLPKILSLLESEDVDVRIHAVKVVANLAAEEVNQEKIVEAGGLTSLLLLLETSEDETIQRVAAGAIANLAMNEKNQELIMRQGGIKLLARIANKAEDPQTLRMVAGAIANLCGNDKLQLKLRDEGGIKALLGMVRSRHQDVLAQVARGVANFAKCESRGAIQGHRKGRSLLIDDGALPWIVTNSNSEVTPIRRHIELALCHLAQHEANARDLVACGALWELVRISRECSREDIRNLARRTLSTSSTFQMELKRMHSPYD